MGLREMSRSSPTAEATTSRLSIVTIAQNEEARIEACLRSARTVGVKHYLIDGGSTDSTTAIAESLGAEVISRPFSYPADQYNFGLGAAQSEWVFILDADERLDRQLVDSLRSFAPDGKDAYYVARKNFVFGQRLRHGGWYPDLNVRLLKVGSAEFENRHVHARVLHNLPPGRLNGNLEHFTYDSVSQYLTKLNSFTTREVLARQAAGPLTERRARHRQLWLHTPFKALTKFLYLYIYKQGFRDHRLGLDVAILGAFYEYIVGIKSRFPATVPNRTTK